MEENIMNPRSSKPIEPNNEEFWDYFAEPHTIPAGWDVSAFFTQEQEYLHDYDMTSDLPNTISSSNTSHEQTEDPF